MDRWIDMKKLKQLEVMEPTGPWDEWVLSLRDSDLDEEIWFDISTENLYAFGSYQRHDDDASEDELKIQVMELDLLIVAQRSEYHSSIMVVDLDTVIYCSSTRESRDLWGQVIDESESICEGLGKAGIRMSLSDLKDMVHSSRVSAIKVVE